METNYPPCCTCKYFIRLSNKDYIKGKCEYHGWEVYPSEEGCKHHK